ncbi:MAG: cadherin-like domain-containing protein [Magnetovibrionaceae bacterium]
MASVHLIGTDGEKTTIEAKDASRVILAAGDVIQVPASDPDSLGLSISGTDLTLDLESGERLVLERGAELLAASSATGIRLEIGEGTTTRVIDSLQALAAFKAGLAELSLGQPQQAMMETHAELSFGPSGSNNGDSSGQPQQTVTPSDDQYRNQWHLHNTSYAGVDLNVDLVWDEYTGNGVRVGVIDDGFDYNHPDLAANYRQDLDYDYSQGDYDAAHRYSSDRHGTSTAGVIGAAMDGSGAVGVAPGVDLVGMRIGFGDDYSHSGLTQAIYDMRYQDVVNNSWGYSSPFSDNFNSYWFTSMGSSMRGAAQYGRDGLGTITVFAAGNERSYGGNTNYHNFQNSPFAITVGAIERDGDISYFSTPGASVLVSAPGTGVLTTDRVGSSGYSSSDYASLNGTSFSAPAVAGVAALMLEANPLLGYRDVQEILAYTAKNPVSSTSGWQTNDANNWNGGGLTFSHDYGFGLADAHAAVRLAETWGEQSTYANRTTVSYTSSPNHFLADRASLTDTITTSSASPMDVEFVEVTLNLFHSYLGDLDVYLVGPGGTRSHLANNPHTGGYSGSFTFSTVAHWGESAWGDWDLEIYDRYSGDTGTIRSWTLALHGTLVDDDDQYIFTNEWARHGGEAARNTLSDDAGDDTLNFAAVLEDLDIDLTPGTVNTLLGRSLTLDAGSVFENAYGGDGNDSFTGNDAANTLYGMRGNDTLDGGSGNDILEGGAGDDVLIGGAGVDTAVYNGNYDAYTVTFGGGNSTVQGADGNDSLSGVEFLQFDDQILNIASSIVTQPDLLTTSEDVPLTFTSAQLLSNDDGEGLTITGFSATSQGSITDNLDGTYTFTPVGDFSGLGSFDYTVTDAEGLTATETVTVNVAAVADQPDLTLTLRDLDGNALSDPAWSISDVGPEIRLDISGALTDLDGSEELTISLTGLPDGVTLSTGHYHGGGNWTLSDYHLDNLRLKAYAPVSEPFSLTVTATATETADGLSASSSSTVEIPPYTTGFAPSRSMIVHRTDEDTVLSGNLDITDIDGDSLSYSLVSPPIVGSFSLDANGDFTYDPRGSFDSLQQGEWIMHLFSFDVTDGMYVVQNQALVRVNGVNDAPEVSGPLSMTSPIDRPLTVTVEDLIANATDPEGDALSVVNVQLDGPGLLSAQSDGTWAYTPAELGTSQITYQVTDGSAVTDAVATIEVTPPAPEAIDGSIQVGIGETVSWTLGQSRGVGPFQFSIDGTADGDGWVSTTQGRVRITDATTGAYEYDPSGSTEGGADSFSYTVTDSWGRSASASMTVGIATGASPDEAQLNTDSVGFQGRPELSTLADGGYVAVWGSRDNVHGQVFDASGSATGSEFQVNQTTAFMQERPDVVTLSDGSFVTVWQSARQDGDAEGIVGRRFDTTGSAIGDEFIVNTYRTFGQSHPSVASLSDGGFAVAWRSEGARDGSGYGVFGQCFDADGAPKGNEFQVNSTTWNSQLAPALTGLAGGGFAVTWTSGWQDGDEDGIYGQVYDDSGTAVGGEFQVNTETAGFQKGSSTTGLSNGGFVVVWQSGGQDGGGYGIYGQVFDAAGSAIGSEFQVNEEVSGNQWQPDVVALTGGGFVVSWQSDGQDGDGHGVYGRIFDAAGSAQNSEFALNLTTAGEQTSPSLTALANGGFVAAWQSPDADGSGIFAQRFSEAGRPLSEVSVSATEGADSLAGADDGDLLEGLGGNDQLIGQGGADRLDGGAGDDILIGGAGDDILIGGDGYDVATYSGTFASYQVTQVGGSGGTLNVTISGPDGTDSLTGVEQARFADGTLNLDGSNNGPNAVADLGATLEDEGITLTAASLLANDTDFDGDALTISAVGNAAGGSVSLTVDGDVRFTPDADYAGSASFEYTASDGRGGTSTTTVTVTVTGVNDAPVAGADSASTLEDNALVLTPSDLLNNDSDVEGDALSVVSVGAAIGGTVEILPDGNVQFTPTGDFNGTARFDYTVMDEHGDSSDATVVVAVASVNDAPDAVGDQAIGTEDTTLTIGAADLLGNDTDVDGDALSIASVGSAVGGTVELTVDGDVRFVPTADFNGSASFDYVVSDGQGGSQTATVVVAVAAVNDTPDAVDDSASTLEDTAITIPSADVLANDTDVDGDLLTIQSVDAAVGGTASLTVDGDVLFTPDADFNGAASFDYTVTDGNGGTASATMSVTVTAVNDAPDVVADTATTAEDTSLSLTAAELLGNDSDVDGDSLTIDAVSGAVGGTVSIVDGGNVVFVPTADFFGTGGFAYTAADGFGGTADGWVTVTVTPVNDAPIAAADSATTFQGEAVTISLGDLLANDVDPDGDALTVTGVSSATGGTVTLTEGISVTFTPDADFTGSAQFSYTIADPSGATSTQTVSVDVVAVTRGQAIDGYIESGTVFADANGNGVLDEGESYATTGPNGTFTLIGGEGPIVVSGGIDASTGLAFEGIMRAPEGASVVTPLTTLMAALDENLGIGLEAARTAVIEAFDLPNDIQLEVFDPVAATLSDDESTASLAAQVMATGVQVQNMMVQASGVLQGAGVSVEVAAQAAIGGIAGMIALNGASTDLTDAAQISSMLTAATTIVDPEPEQRQMLEDASADVSSVLAASAAVVETAQAELTGRDLLVQLAQSAVIAQGDSADALQAAVASQDQSLLDQAVSDYTGDGLTSNVTAAADRIGDPDGTELGTANADIMTGDDTANAIDGLGGDDRISGGGGNDRLFGGDGNDRLTGGSGDDQLTGGDGTDIAVYSSAYDAFTIARNGETVTVTAADGTDTLTGIEQIEFSDRTIYLDGTNNLPTAAGETVSTDEDQAITILASDLLANDADFDGDALSISAAENAIGGTVTLLPDGNVRFVPSADFAGDASFEYVVSDGNGGAARATATVNVAEVNDTPVATIDSLTGEEDTTLSISAAELLDNDTDVDGDTLSISAVRSPVGGSVILLPDGSVQFAPAADFNGLAQFEYEVADGRGGSAWQTATIAVAARNDAPTAGSDSASTSQNAAITLAVTDLLANDSDVDGDTLSITGVGGAVGGTVSLADGVVTFAPTPGFFGTGSFTYTLDDGQGGTDTATVVVAIAENAAPVSADDLVWAPIGQETTITAAELLANDSDPEGDALSISGVSNVQGGSASLDSDGNVRFTPDADLAGNGSFDYTVSDGRGGTTTATATVSIPGQPTAMAGSVQTGSGEVVSWRLGQTGGQGTVTYSIEGAADADGWVSTTQGRARITDATTGAYEYEPNSGSAGAGDSFRFRVTDAWGQSSTAEVSVGISGGGSGEEVVLNSGTSGHQSAPSVSGLSDGNYVAVWGSDSDVVGQVFSPAGDTVGTEIQLSQSASNRQEFPAVAGLDGGGFVAVWQAFRQDGDAEGIIGRLFDASGVPTDTEFVVNTVTQFGQVHPSVASLSDGGFIVSWMAEGNRDGSGFALFGQQFDSSGSTVGEEFQINTYSHRHQFVPEVTGLENGGYVVTWTSGWQDGDEDGVYGQVFDASGEAVGAEFQVTEESAGFQNKSSVTGLANGGFVAVWQSGGQDGDGYGVYARVFDATGNAAGSEFLVNTETSGNQTLPSVAALSGGGFAVTWQSEDQDGEGYGIFGKVFDDAGTTVAAEYQINTEAAGEQTHSSIAALADGGFVVSWQGDDADGRGIFAQRFSSTGDAVSEITTTATAGHDSLAGGADGDQLDGEAGDDRLLGHAGNDQLNGGEGDDVLVGGAGDDVLSGGEGVDTAVYSGAYVDYVVAPAGGGGAGVLTAGFTVQGPDGTDSLTGIERLEFADGTLNLDGSNNAPTAAGDIATVQEDGSLTISASDLLANDQDFDNDVLSIASVGNASGGAVSLTPGGDVLFNPTADFNGTASFDYTVSDGRGGTATSSVSVTVSGVNDAPVATGDAVTTAEDTAITLAANTLLANDSDVDGDALSISAVGNAIGGTVSLTADGDVRFVPTAEFNGAAGFDYTVSDGQGGETTSTVTVAVSAVNDAPVAADDTLAAVEDTAVTFSAASLVGNDTDVDGDALSISAVGSAVGGSVTLTAGGDVRFTPTSDFNGTARFDYTVSDGQGGTAVATAVVAVAAVNDAPVAAADTVSTPQDQTLTLTAADLLGNDQDVDGDNLVILSVNGASNGTATLRDDGGVDFVPTPGFNGTAGFSYVVSDGQGGTDSQTVTITVSENSAPTLTADQIWVPMDGQVTTPLATLLANDSDPDGDTLTVTQVDQAVNGTVSLDGNGNAVFTPTPGYSGTGSFRYTVSDGQGGTSQATVTVDIPAMPVATDGSVQTGAGTAVSWRLSDTANQTGLTYSIEGTADGDGWISTSGGRVRITDATTGAYEYEPSAGASGDSFQFRVTDTWGQSSLGSVSVGISGSGGSGEESVLNSETAGHQFASSVSGLDGGGYVAVWGSGDDIYGRVFNGSGEATATEVQLNETTAHHQELPVVATLSGGGFVTVWQSAHQDGDAEGIIARIFDSSGVATGSEFVVNSFTSLGQVKPAVASLSDGGFVVSWMSEGNRDGSGFAIFGQRFDAAGAAVGDEFQINTFAHRHQFIPEVTGLENGGFVATWISGWQDGDEDGIFGQVFDAAGNRLGDEFSVNAETAGFQSASSITALSGGGFVAVWQSSDQDGDGYGVYGRVFDAAGNATSSEFLVNTETSGFQGLPEVAALNNGTFAVTWQSEGQDGDGLGIYGQIFNADGTASGTEFQVNSETTNEQSNPSIAALTNGGFVVSWEGQDADGRGIYAQRFSSTGEALTEVTVTATSGQDSIAGGSEGDRLEGLAGDDQLMGLGGNDTLVGGTGDDYLLGGDGDDLFVFEGVSNGNDTIGDFTAGSGSGDAIDLRDASFANFLDVTNALDDQGGTADAVLDLGDGNSVTLLGVRIADLDSDDFLL